MNDDIDPSKWTETRHAAEDRKALKAAGRPTNPHAHNVHKPKTHPKVYRVPRLMPDGTIKEAREK